MIVMIAGPRDLMVPTSLIAYAVARSGFHVDVHVNGMAKGIDRCARRWALEQGVYVIPLEARWAYWTKQGATKYAGPERNDIGARISDALIILKRPGKYSRGTYNVRDSFMALDKPVYVEVIEEGDEI